MRGYIAPMVMISVGTPRWLLMSLRNRRRAQAKTAKELAKVLKYTRDISSATTGIDELNILEEAGWYRI